MIQKDDRKYTFVVTRSTRNSLKIIRFQISRRLVQICISAFILTFSVYSYKIYNSARNSNNIYFSQIYSSNINPDISTLVDGSSIENSGFGEGGPEITENSVETGEPTNLSEKFEAGEENLINKDEMPSIYPLAGKINDDFGWRRNPFGDYSSEFHSGLDISGEKGDIVMAPAGGTVVKAGWSGGYGNMIEISHGYGLTTRYGHLSQIDVEVSDQVARGQEIGNVGSTGRSTGPHLHYEVRLHDKPVNPRSYLPVASTEP